MKNLNYATVATDRHHVVVSTWEDPDGSLWFKMSVDGRLLEEGTLDDLDDWPEADLPTPTEFDDEVAP